jgi:hypothetical protein
LTSASDIDRFLGVLARHGELISEIYQSSSIESTDEIRGALHELHNARAVTPCGAGHFRLSRPVKALLDDHTQRQRSFEIGDDIGAEIKRMRDLIDEYLRAANEGRHDDMVRLESEVLESIYNIQDSVSSDLLRFRQITESSYSTVHDLSEKARQNAHYLRRAMALQDVLAALNSRDMHEALSSALADDLASVFHEEISARIGAWSALLLASVGIMKEFLFRYREITRETRRLRAFHRILKSRSPADAETAMATAAWHPLLARPVEAVEAPLPDFITGEGRDEFSDVVRTFKPIQQKRAEERKAGKRALDDGPLEVGEEISPEEAALSAFLSVVDASYGWVSARAWLDPAENIEPTSFLEQVLAWWLSDRDCERDANLKEAGHRCPRSGNMEIEDIQVCRVA